MRAMIRVAALGAALIALTGAAAPGTPDTPPPAVWQPQELSFAYSGFTSRYSCIGLRDELRDVLLALGARKDDLKISYYNCGIDPDRPAAFPGVKLKFSVLQPVAGGATDGLPVHWSALDVGRIAKLEAGDCELAEQVKQKLLPLFATRKLDGNISCTPRQQSTGRPTLRLEVLTLDTATAAK